jgi:hypothetical protein
MRKNKYIKVYPNFGPVRHDLLNGDGAMLGLHLRLSGPTRHGPFLFRAVSGHAPNDTSPARLGPRWPGTACWPDITMFMSLWLHDHLEWVSRRDKWDHCPRAALLPACVAHLYCNISQHPIVDRVGDSLHHFQMISRSLRCGLMFGVQWPPSPSCSNL